MVEPPRLVDERFELQAEVGAGGMGVVYRAFDRARGNLVALKLHNSTSASSITRFAREAQVLALLSHPNIVKYVAHGVLEGDRLYVAMEWMEGATLFQQMNDRGLTLAEAITVALDVADGLSHIHRHGILHRDLKPSNVMQVAGRAKIIDFGLARRMRDDTKLTQTGTAMGTPGYMAPEQIRGSTNLDVRVDVFALGCLLYECVSGAMAFQGPNWVAVQTKILLKPVAPPSVYGVALPLELEQLLLAMLEKDPDHRPPDVATVTTRLRALGDLDTTVRQTFRGPVPVTLKQPIPWRSPAEPEYLVLALTAADTKLEQLDALVAPFGVKVTRLAEGAIVIRIEPGEGDAAKRAALCALAVRELAANWPINIVRNREGAIDDATQDLAAQELSILFKRGPVEIKLDAETAALLEEAFDVRRTRNGMVLARR